MAERYTTPPTQLEAVLNEINITFDNLILQLNNRRQALLDEVREMSEEITAKKTHVKSQIEDLTAMQANIQIKLRYNEMRDAQERILAEVNQQLNRLDLSKENEYLSLKFSEEKLKEAIDSFGSIIKMKGTIPNYSNMKQPIVAVGKHGDQPGEINYPGGVAFCEESKQIFIADITGYIHIFSENGMFNKRIGGVLEYPHGVVVYKNSLYVTDATLQAIILFKLPKCKLIKSVTSFSLGVLKGKDYLYTPRGITVSNKGDVFIADIDNNRIVITDGDLAFKHQLTHTSIKYPINVTMHADTLFILCMDTDHAIQVFSLKGSYLYSIIAKHQFMDCGYFCMDIIGNIIMSDMEEHNIKAFNRNGELTHIIGKEGSNKGEFHNPTGIVVTDSGKLISVSYNNNYCLQILQ